MNGAAERHNVVQERSYAFAVSIVRLSRQLKRAREYELASQLLRSGTSIGANVEEAQAAQSKPDFVAKMAVACKEARETGYWLRLIRDSEAAAPSEITPPDCARSRSGRIRRRDPRGAARDEGGVRGEGGRARRHLPARRVHPLQGAARLVGAVRPDPAQGGAARDPRGDAGDRRRRHDEAQGRGRHRPDARGGRALQEEQDRVGPRLRPAGRAPTPSRSTAPRAIARSGRRTSCSPAARCRSSCRS
jgi:four helix bundle protein